MVEKFINGFVSEVKHPNIFLFSLMLANKFKGELLIKDDMDESLPDIIVLIDGVFYDIFGEVDSNIIELDGYNVLDKLNVLSNIRFYNYIKWSFIHQESDDEMYYNDVN
jgi:hypothetical protein